ncbi:GTP-binding protein [Candidatus Thorarchaeota archaeon]|nr:MAG: GTP-binding protein [Candidatus Thorarchaeota archaeon]
MFVHCSSVTLIRFKSISQGLFSRSTGCRLVVEIVSVPAYKLLLVGNANVGKSSLIRWLLLGDFDPNYTATVGVDLSAVALNVDGQTPVIMTMIDLGGQSDFTALRTQYYRGAHGAALVYDVSARDSFENLPIWYEDLMDHIAQPNGTKFEGIVIGNKIDKAARREVSSSEGRSFAESIDWPFHETSAKSGENVEEVFGGIAKRMYVSYPPLKTRAD